MFKLYFLTITSLTIAAMNEATKMPTASSALGTIDRRISPLYSQAETRGHIFWDETAYLSAIKEIQHFPETN
jgi:hypothetical protein